MLDSLLRLSAFVYHSANVLLLDLHIAALHWRMALRARKIRRVEEQLNYLREEHAGSCRQWPARGQGKAGAIVDGGEDK